MGVIVNFGDIKTRGHGYFSIRHWDTTSLAIMYQYQGQKYPITGYLLCRHPNISFFKQNDEEEKHLHINFEVVIYFTEYIYSFNCIINDKSRIDVHYGESFFIGKYTITNDVFANTLPTEALVEYKKILEKLLTSVSFDNILCNILKETFTFEISLRLKHLCIYQASIDPKKSRYHKYTICGIRDTRNHIEEIPFGLKYSSTDAKGIEIYDFSQYRNFMFFMGLREEYDEARSDLEEILSHLNSELLLKFINAFQKES